MAPIIELHGQPIIIFSDKNLNHVNGTIERKRITEIQAKVELKPMNVSKGTSYS